MKKFLAILLALVMILSLAACGGAPAGDATEPAADEGGNLPSDGDTPSADEGGDLSPDEGTPPAEEEDPPAPIVPSDEILTGTPTVDGVLDKMYEYSYRLTVTGDEHTFHTSKGGTKSGSYGDSATAYYLYDNDCLYVCIVVKDDAVYSRGEEWAIANIRDLSWENDAVEARIYYEELGEAKQANQYIFQCDAYGYATTNYLSMCEEPHTVETAFTEDGYVVEFAIPLSFGKTAGDQIGLTIEIDDLHEEVVPTDTAMGTHNFSAYGSQHPYGNMVTLSELEAPEK